MIKRLLSIFLVFLAVFRVSAQNGSTPVIGQNPAAPSSSVARTGDPMAPQDGSTVLGPTYQLSACGLNYTSATQKIGQRFSPVGVPQPATFAIAGIPAAAVIQKAYVWCDASGNGAAITITVTNPFASSSNFAMTMIGQDQDKCWGYQGTYSYRADVTAIIAGNGNYTISGFPTSVSSGGTNDVDGATMVVIWSDPTQNWQGDINIWDGCVVINGGTTTQTMTGFSACPNVVNNARAFMCIADLQFPPPSTTQSQLTLNGVSPITCNEDWWNYIDVATTVTPGQSTSTFGNSAGGDCYNFCVMGLYWQSNCQTCCASPFTLNMTSTPSQCSNNNGTATSTPQGGTGPFTYTWTNGDSTQTSTNLGPGQYIVTVTDSLGCTTTDTIIVAGQGSLGLAGIQTDNLCNGQSIGTATVTPTGGSGPFTYVWNPAVAPSTDSIATGLAAGVYTVDVTDNFGCMSSYTFTITEPPLVPIVASISGTSPICNGQSSTLTASATGGAPPYSFQWITPAQAGTTITVSPTATTTYSCVVTDACGTPADTATFTVTVNQLPVINVTSDVQQGCAPLCVTFNGTSNPSSVSCNWQFGDNTTSTGCNPVHCYTTAGTYTVILQVNDINGCSNTLTLPNYIDVYPNPVAAFGIASEQPANILDPTVVFDDLSTGGDTCYWDFGDGNTLAVVGCGDVANSYIDTGTFVVTQIVVTQFGCADTITYDVIIIPNTSFYIPNTFTPNGDGKNEVFFAYGEFVDDFHMMIFDRWGNLIFESSDMTKGWDGRANNGKDIAQIDTYVWKVTFKEQYTGRQHKLVGHVNLVR